jgi:hypothetical protein
VFKPQADPTPLVNARAWPLTPSSSLSSAVSADIAKCDLRARPKAVARQVLLSGHERFLEKPFTPAALLVAAGDALGQTP